VSEENIEIVRTASRLVSESAQRGELVDAMLELCGPDIHIDASRRVFNPAIYEGHEGLRQMIREIWEAWEGFTSETERFVDAGDKVLSIETIRGRGRVSQAAVEARGALVWTLEKGRVTRVETYIDVDEALEALGARTES
jgi:ketosteroid isomerase-like protein